MNKWKLEFPEGFKRPECPNCKQEMVLRDSFKGAFFGCKNFPNCKGTVDMATAIGNKVQEPLPTINLDEEDGTPEQELPVTEKVDSPDGSVEEVLTQQGINAESTEVEDEVKIEDVPF